MIVARIKGLNRREAKKTLFGNIKEFKVAGVTYNIDPRCIYRGAYGFFKSDCIDFIQGIRDPIPYYELKSDNIIHGKKNRDTISSLIYNWIKGTLQNYNLYILLICIGSLIVSIISIILLYTIGSNGGFL